MEKIKYRLTRSLEKYEALQKEQMDAFETRLLPDIETHNFKRASVFADLKNDLDDLLNLIHDNQDVMELERYSSRLNKILAVDDLLREKLIQYRSELLTHMGNTNKSKIAFDGYSKGAGLNRKKPIYLAG
mgnify:CR=1 FL=1